MKIILKVLLGWAMLFPLLLYGHNEARDERAGGNCSGEIQGKIFQAQRQRGGFDLGVSFGTAHALTYSLSHPNPGHFTRGYHFRNTVFEVALQAEAYLPKELLNIRSDIYVFAGFLVLFHEPHLKDAAGRIQPSQLASPQPVIRLGLGIHYTTLQNLRLGFQAGVRNTFFDYLDGFSPVEGPRKDIYFFNSFTIGYRITPGRKFYQPNAFLQTFVNPEPLLKKISCGLYNHVSFFPSRSRNPFSALVLQACYGLGGFSLSSSNPCA